MFENLEGAQHLLTRFILKGSRLPSARGYSKARKHSSDQKRHKIVVLLEVRFDEVSIQFTPFGHSDVTRNGIKICELTEEPRGKWFKILLVNGMIEETFSLRWVIVQILNFESFHKR